jgi:hypothetical protein
VNEGGEGNGQDIKILLLVGKIMGWVWMLMLFSMFKLCMGNLVFDIVLEIDILLPHPLFKIDSNINNNDESC